jgi:hypothetical protein
MERAPGAEAFLSSGLQMLNSGFSVDLFAGPFCCESEIFQKLV